MENMDTIWKKLRFWIMGGVLLIIGTILFRISDAKYDKLITSMFYDANAPIGSRFPTQYLEPWHFFNEYNDFFTYFLILILFGMFLLSVFKSEKYGFMRRYALFGMFAVALGAGVLVNNVFKGFWGRPRPRHTTLWPDTDDPIGRFYAVWEPAFLIDPNLIDKGVSFPSGHVSIIVAYIVLFYIFMNPDIWVKKLAGNSEKIRKIVQTIKWGALIFTILIGILTGIGRIVAGAHHASDVLWAFGIVWIFTGLMYYIFQIPKWEQTLLTAD
jgi:membrane-associated phospholipid phosphatase